MRITSKYTCRKDRGGCGKHFVARKSIVTLDRVTCPSCGTNWQQTKKIEGGRRIPIIERHKTGKVQQLAEAVEEINEAAVAVAAAEPATPPEPPKATKKDAKAALLRKAKGGKNGSS